MARERTAVNVTARHYEIWKGVNASLESINAYTDPPAANEDALRMQIRSVLSDNTQDADKTLRERIVKTLGEYPRGEPNRKILLPQTGPDGTGDRICIVEDAPSMTALRGGTGEAQAAIKAQAEKHDERPPGSNY